MNYLHDILNIRIRLTVKLSEITEVWRLMDETLADLRNYLDHPKKETMVSLFGK